MNLPLIGYMGDLISRNAAFRLRVDIPAHHCKFPYFFGAAGDLNFVYRRITEREYASLKTPLIYDFSNDLLNSNVERLKKEAYMWVDRAKWITCTTEPIQQSIFKNTGRIATVIPDPYEFEPQLPRYNQDDTLLWFGHEMHIKSILPIKKKFKDKLIILSNCPDADIQWTLEKEKELLKTCGGVLITSVSKNSSNNRLIKSIMMGKFTVVAGNAPPSYHEFDFATTYKQYIDYRSNPDPYHAKILLQQEEIKRLYSPEAIGLKWQRFWIERWKDHTGIEIKFD